MVEMAVVRIPKVTTAMRRWIARVHVARGLRRMPS